LGHTLGVVGTWKGVLPKLPGTEELQGSYKCTKIKEFFYYKYSKTNSSDESPFKTEEGAERVAEAAYLIDSCSSV
jgi:hypothetical protein